MDATSAIVLLGVTAVLVALAVLLGRSAWRARTGDPGKPGAGDTGSAGPAPSDPVARLDRAGVVLERRTASVGPLAGEFGDLREQARRLALRLDADRPGDGDHAASSQAGEGADRPLG